jgi:hypothetical protein
LKGRVGFWHATDASSTRDHIPKGNAVPNSTHQRAAEFHDLAAHAHRAAAVHHGKGDHQTAHEHSKEALEYSNKAHQRSEEAIKKSANTAV